MYPRELARLVHDRLKHSPAVAISGPRQAGKTTLAHSIAKDIPSVYIDLEKQEDLQKLQDPAHYFELHADKLVVLDEVQRYPDLFMSLRGVIDEGRRKSRANGRFLVLGPASRDLLRQSSESLAGRISYLGLSGLKPSEIEATDEKHIRRLWLRGGFPDSYTSSDDARSFAWRQDFISTYLERDIPQLGPRVPAQTLRRLWTMLAHSQGEPLNASKLAGALDISGMTVSRYIDLMDDLMLVRRLRPWSGNSKKRLVKSPRIYIRDSGLVHALSGIPDYEALLGHPVLGKSWEGFVTENILSSLPPFVNSYFYRTSAGAEIDLLLEMSADNFWAVEIKSGKTPKAGRGFHAACADLNVGRKLVVYSGEDIFSLTNDTIALSLPLFLGELSRFHGAASTPLFE